MGQLEAGKNDSTTARKNEGAMARRNGRRENENWEDGKMGKGENEKFQVLEI